MGNRNEDLLLLVGQLNYSWTNTESLLIHIMEHLMETRKDVATIVFLTLNTTRARLDLIERIVKLKSLKNDDRRFVLDIASRMRRVSGMRNKYNHCIYGFDDDGLIESTQLMRIADYGTTLVYGRIERIDGDEMSRIRASINDIVAVNHDIVARMQSWQEMAVPAPHAPPSIPARDQAELRQPPPSRLGPS